MYFIKILYKNLMPIFLRNYSLLAFESLIERAQYLLTIKGLQLIVCKLVEFLIDKRI